MLSILIADKQEIFRNGLQHLLLRELSTEIVDICNIDNLKSKISSRWYDILVLGAVLQDNIHGPEAIGNMLSRLPDLKILLAGNGLAPMIVREYFIHGVSGYIEQSSSEHDFKAALLSISQGNFYLENKLMAYLISEGPANENEKKLSKREMEIVNLFLEGHLQRDICIKLDLKPSTINTHKKRIFKKMGVTNFADLLYKAKLSFYNPKSN